MEEPVSSCASFEKRAARLPVTFIGLQETNEPGKKLALVNQPDGSTVIFNPKRHEMVRPGKLRLRASSFTDQAFKARIGRTLGMSNIKNSERKRNLDIGKKENPLGR